MPNKKHTSIKIRNPLLLHPYSIVYKPFPVPTITDICEGYQFNVWIPCALLPYLLGALESWVWEDSFIGTPDEQKIAVGLFHELQRKIAMASNDCGCEDRPAKLTRINPTTGELEQSSDNGATWVTDPNSPYANATHLPPLTGDNGDNKRCIAANNVIGQLKEIQARWSGWIGVLTGITDLMAQLVIEVLMLLFMPEGNEGITEAIARILGKVYDAAKEMTNTTQAAYDAMFTQQIWDNALCIVLCEVQPDGTFTDAGYARIKSRFDNELNVPPASAGSSLRCMMDAMGLVGLNNAATLHNQSQAPCDDCSCANCSNLDHWQVVYGTISLQEPGHLRIQSGDAGGGNTACRIANYHGGATPECCFVTYDFNSSPINTAGYYDCTSQSFVNGLPPGGVCSYDIGVTNLFGQPMTIDFYFSDCE